MTHADLLALAAWHDREAMIAERDAVLAENNHWHDLARRTREKAQFHASTVIHLRELAEIFKSAFSPLETV